MKVHTVTDEHANMSSFTFLVPPSSFLDDVSCAGEHAQEFLELLRKLADDPKWKSYLAMRGVLPRIGALIGKVHVWLGECEVGMDMCVCVCVCVWCMCVCVLPRRNYIFPHGLGTRLVWVVTWRQFWDAK